MTKSKPKTEDKAQSERFVKKARDLGADESGEAFERAFRRIVPEKKLKQDKDIK